MLKSTQLARVIPEGYQRPDGAISLASYPGALSAHLKHLGTRVPLLKKQPKPKRRSRYISHREIPSWNLSMHVLY